jgi:hypothetical protein
MSYLIQPTPLPPIIYIPESPPLCPAPPPNSPKITLTVTDKKCKEIMLEWFKKWFKN